MILWTAFATALLSAATGQPAGSGRGPVRGGEPAGLVPVDPNTSDASPLGLSFRQLRLDFRRPTDFDRVYRLTGIDGKPKFARISGGLAAVFPRSRYVQINEQGDSVAVVPADTRWIIGSLAPVQEAIPSLVPAWNRVDRLASSGVARVSDLRVDRARWDVGTLSPGLSSAPTMLTDDRFRGRRVADLLMRAAGAWPGEHQEFQSIE